MPGTNTTQNSYPLANQLRQHSPLVFGCMNLGGGWNKNPLSAADISEANQIIDAALDAGIRIFDHADIYTFGKAEQVFGKVLAQRPELRQHMSLQSKCGIRFADDMNPQRYDFSEQWIIESVNNILRRLQTEQLDILLLHRPDPLMEPAEVASAFAKLTASGKVKHFGVSNMQQHQMALLQDSVLEPFIVNQLELSLSHLAWLDEGTTAGCSGQPPANFSSGTIEYCRRHNIQLQAWGSLSQGLFSGKDISQQPSHVQVTAKLVQQLAAEYQVSSEAIVLGWLMRHPANIQPVIGTTSINRIKACGQAPDVRLSREHWYALYLSARGSALP
ncbi:aldo/keto reductase [Arsukibacterium indicum]|uniref:Aldo/keto reductase n=1 Tax=Arsukibacterium indicum TaxID=2848612 RepID=A0ABS6MP12_9GAMM|nr:aldo/keto reductase [Arsukibacterium indicum]MBV2130320.1 aldo/keto reductase [Arsukibacterium indicum]